MTTCPTCKGTKKQTINVTTLNLSGSNKEDKNAPVEIPCVICDATGEVSDTKLEEIEFAKTMWCECEEDHGVDYYKDREHPEISKHHYRCKKCKKVVQIG